MCLYVSATKGLNAEEWVWGQFRLDQLKEPGKLFDAPEVKVRRMVLLRLAENQDERSGNPVV